MLNSRERRKARRAAERKMASTKTPSPACTVQEVLPTATATEHERLRLSPKEGVLLLIGTALALGSLPGNDPQIVLPMLGISWFAFLWLFFAHAGNRALRALGAVAITAILGWIGMRLYREAPPATAAVTSSAKEQEPFLNPFEHPCERMLIFSNPDNIKRTYVTVQLFPPTCEDQQAISTPVSQLKIQFRNLGNKTDHNASLRITVPFANKATCEGDRVRVVSGPDPDKSVLAGVVHIIAPELVPEEAHTCEITLLKASSDGTPTEWKQKNGTYRASSDLYGTLDVDLHRVHFGPIEATHNSKIPYNRKMTKEVN